MILKRHLKAQKNHYEKAFQELTMGKKTGHWMWFIFPQVAGLGSSWTARRYAIGNLAEAQEYLEHPVLGNRLRVVTELTLNHRDKTAIEIFGHPDDLKFRSCLTLFASITAEDDIFARGLQYFFDGEPDPLTLHLLQQ